MGANLRENLRILLGRLDPNSLPNEVDEELRFHIDMQAQAYEISGLAHEEALEAARLRFGHFQQIKTECVQIGSRTTARTLTMKYLFTMSFILGVLIRIGAPEYRVTRIGDVLMMIGILGGLLLMSRQMHKEFRPTPTPIRLGLTSTPDSKPIAFDEKGRTPFERVKADD